MKVFEPLVTLYHSVCGVISSFFVDEYEKADHELSALEEAFIREVLPEVLKKK